MRHKKTSVKFPSSKCVTEDIIENGLTFSSFGYNKKGGKLENAYKVEVRNIDCELPSSVTSAFYSDWRSLLFAYGDNGLFVGDGDDFKKFDFRMTDTPIFLQSPCDGDYLACYFADEAINYYTLKGTIKMVGAPYNIAASAYHCGRVFMVDADNRRYVRWAGANGVHDENYCIDGSGWVCLTGDGGDILKLVPFKDDIVAVRNYSLTVLHFYGQSELFTVGGSYLTCDGVIGETVALCNGCVTFCTDSGIYAFDGNSVDKLTNDCEDDLIDIERAVAFGDKYYIMCTSKKSEGKVVFVYDCEEETGCYLDIAPETIVAAADGVVAFLGGHIYDIAAATCGGEWVSKPISFGENCLTYLKYIDVDGDEDVKVTVSSRGVERHFEGCGRIRAGMPGDNFVFKVCGGNVGKIKATAEVIE